MKKALFISLISIATLVTGCIAPNGTTDGNSSGGILGALGGSTTLSGLGDLIIGKIKISPSELEGTWKYSSPGCAFTSENLLAQAGGAAIAAQIKETLKSYYTTVGINNKNTIFTFTKDGKFDAQIGGIPWSGSYTFNSQDGSIALKGLLLSSTAYLTRTSSGMSLTFESKKFLSILQGAAKLSGNSTLGSIGDLSTNYKGVRIGFDMVR